MFYENRAILAIRRFVWHGNSAENVVNGYLPDSLVKQVKLRAVREGRKLKDAVADLLRKGLAAAARAEPDGQGPVITRDKKTVLPLIECKQAAAPQDELTPERVADILLAQEVEWHHGAGR